MNSRLGYRKNKRQYFPSATCEYNVTHVSSIFPFTNVWLIQFGIDIILCVALFKILYSASVYFILIFDRPTDKAKSLYL